MTRDQPSEVAAPKQEFTGAGFIPIELLVETVTAYQQRQKLSEEVDFLGSKGGSRW